MEKQDLIVYACSTHFCGYLFSSTEKELKQCPDCGKYSLRIANEKEKRLFAERNILREKKEEE